MLGWWIVRYRLRASCQRGAISKLAVVKQGLRAGALRALHYKGETTAIPAVTGDFCLACREAVLTAYESARVNVAMLAFKALQG